MTVAGGWQELSCNALACSAGAVGLSLTQAIVSVARS